jgi:hypothetical protein
MENTRRIRKSLLPAARRIIAGRGTDQHSGDELWHISQVDQAYVLMLVECGIVPVGRGVHPLMAIRRLREKDFAPLSNGKQCGEFICSIKFPEPLQSESPQPGSRRSKLAGGSPHARP